MAGGEFGESASAGGIWRKIKIQVNNWNLRRENENGCVHFDFVPRILNDVSFKWWM